jgi:hypothetical protein
MSPSRKKKAEATPPVAIARKKKAKATPPAATARKKKAEATPPVATTRTKKAEATPPVATTTKIVPKATPPAATARKKKAEATPPVATTTKIVLEATPLVATTTKIVPEATPPAATARKKKAEATPPVATTTKIVLEATPLVATTTKIVPEATPPAATARKKKAEATPPVATARKKKAEATPPVATTRTKKTEATPPVATARKKKAKATPAPVALAGKMEADATPPVATPTTKIVPKAAQAVAPVYNRVQLSGTRLKSLKAVMFRDSNGFFELNKGPLDAFVDWPDFRSYTEFAIGGSRLFRISLVGIDCSDSGKVGAPKLASRRETSRALVKSLYLSNFNAAPADAAAIESAVNSFQTFALLVSRGRPPRRLERRRNQPANASQSIFDLVDEDATKGGSSLECIAAITVSVCTEFQFVHWLAVSQNHTEGSAFQSWRHRGVGAYMLHTVIARSMLPSVNLPTQFVLQCLDNRGAHAATSPLQFYCRLGFIVHRQVDNGWSIVKDDIGFHALLKASPSVWVTPEETKGMCLLELPHGQLVNYAQRVLEVDEKMPDTPSNVYAQFPIACELHEIEGLTNGLEVMQCLGEPLYDTNSSIAERQCVYVVRDSSDTALVSGTVARDWRIQYHQADATSLWMSSGGLALLLAWTVRSREVYRSKVLIIPPDITCMIAQGWAAFNAVTKADRSLNAPLYDKLEEKWLLQERSMLAYINREKDLFQRRFIFFVNNHTMRHWSVTVAIQPGLVDNVDPTSLCGLLHMDSSPGKGHCTVKPDPRLGCRFFLNYAYSVLIKPKITEGALLNSVDTPSTDEVPFRQPFGPSMHVGATSAFPQVVFAQPSIVVQRDSVNCGLGVVINVALFLKKMLNLPLARNGQGVVDRADTLVLDEFYAPISELKHLRPEYLCEMFRREIEVFLDRLALLTHRRQSTLDVDVESFQGMRKKLRPIFCMRDNLYQHIHGAPKPVPTSIDSEICGGGDKCLHPGRPATEPFELCIACQAKLHIGCASPTKAGSEQGLCQSCYNKTTAPAKAKEKAKGKQKKLPKRPQLAKGKPIPKGTTTKKPARVTQEPDDNEANRPAAAKPKATATQKGKHTSDDRAQPTQQPPKKKAKQHHGNTDKAYVEASDEEEREFDANAVEELLPPDVPPPLLQTLTRREFQEQQQDLKTSGGLERFIEARQTLADSQEKIASEKDLEIYVANSFKREKFYTDAQFATYEMEMNQIISACRRDKRGQGAVDAAYNRGFLIAARRQRKEMRLQFTHEWMRTCEGAIRGLRYVNTLDKFRARVLYYSFRKKAKQTATVDVTEEWLDEHFGVDSKQHIKDCAIEETDGFLHVLQPAVLVPGAKMAMMKLRFITTNRRSSPRKQRFQPVEADDGYWEGTDAKEGRACRLADDAVAPEIKTFYANRQINSEEMDGSFVLLPDDLPKPTIVVDDSPPVISVQFTPEWIKQVKTKTQLDASERFLRYGQALGAVLNKTRQQTHEKMQGNGTAAAAIPVADFGYDTIQYEDRVIPESWRVRQSDNTIVEVTRKRVVELFGEGYTAEVQQRGLNGHRSKTPFIDVPVGACRIPRLSYFPNLFREGAPQVRFPQGNHDTCIYSSFASALHFLGATAAANQIQNAAITDSGSDPATVLGSLAKRVIQTELRFLQQRRIPKTFNFISDLDESMILIGSLVASDGSVNHAITITRGWVFDSNEYYAFPLTKEALDVCTQSEEEATLSGSKSTFSHFGHGKIYEDKTKCQRLAAIQKKKDEGARS